MARRKAIYFIGQPERIGEACDQMSWVRNIYPDTEYDLTIVWPVLRPVANQAVMDILCRGLPTEQVRSREELQAVYNKIHQAHPDVLILNDARYARFVEEFFAFNCEPRKFIASLTAEELARGEQIRARLGMPSDAKVVTLHVRSGGYLPHLSYHSYRDANISHYHAAIRYLVDKGYWVVRLGDKSMQKLQDFPNQVIDTPFHPLYEPFFDPYFVACSRFYIGVPSGPMGLAHVLGVPKLITNYYYESIGPKTGKDLIVHKKYFSEQLGRLLTYEEAITSPVVSFTATHLFEQSGIRLLENSSEEILRATWEMDTTLDGTYPHMQEAEQMQRHIKSIEEKAHVLSMSRSPEERGIRMPYYISYLAKARISHEFIRLNPGFLGHLWPKIQWPTGAAPVIEQESVFPS
ncbi:MAG: TIGR04372 family glycosyltransferase [Magnetococcus sp. XQGC-1]